MYIVILGAGKIGTSVARWLLGARHEVSVIDRDISRCEILDESLGNVSVLGDGTEAGVMAKAGTNRADVFIAATGRDEDNLVACQLAKERFGVSRVVSLVNLPELEKLFNILRIDVSISITDLVSSRIQEELGNLLVEEEVGEIG